MTRSKQSRKNPALTASRRRAFAVITLSIPIAVLVMIELGLRVIGYGPDLSLFTTEVLAGKTHTVMNPDVKNRYFARVTFNPSTSPDYFLIPKPEGTYRIFCLGASTTVGYPYWYNGSFSSFLRDRLRRVFPEKSIEVINVGMTATNSFTVNDMAAELVNYEPDLFIVYDGHNEFYGALGVASNESTGGSRWMTKLHLRAIHLKTFYLMREMFVEARAMIAGKGIERSGGTMMERLAAGQFIPFDSPLYAKGLNTYRENLSDLVALCAARRIPLLLGSQISNLRDLHPFISEHQLHWSTGQRDAFEQHFQTGLSHWKDGSFIDALGSFTDAMHLDSLHAGIYYRIARCLDTLGRKHEALQAYARARDLDQLRFRMSSDFNAAMREAGSQKGAAYVDIERKFKEDSPDSLIGFNLLFEHVHPKSRGYFLIAKEYARSMRELALLASREEWSQRDTVSDETHWNSRCVTPMDELLAIRRTEILTSGWPFVSQTPTVNAVAKDDTLALIVENMTRARWNWGQAHNAAADYYLRRGEWNNAERELLTITNQLPLLEEMPYLKLAHLYINQSRLPAAREQLVSSLAIKPTILAYRALGDIAMREGMAADAVAYYRRTFTFQQSPPEQVENGYLLALALFRSDSLSLASTEALRVLRIKPDHGPTVRLLNQINAPR